MNFKKFTPLFYTLSIVAVFYFAFTGYHNAMGEDFQFWDVLFSIISIFLLLALCNAFNIISSRNHASSLYMKDVLLIGGTRFSGLYLWRQLHKDGHKVTIFNRGKTSLKKIPIETDDEFEKRKADANYVKGDRTKPEDLQQLASLKFDVIYDMNIQLINNLSK